MPDLLDIFFAIQFATSPQSRPSSAASAPSSKLGSWIQPFTLSDAYLEPCGQAAQPSGGYDTDR